MILESMPKEVTKNSSNGIHAKDSSPRKKPHKLTKANSVSIGDSDLLSKQQGITNVHVRSNSIDTNEKIEENKNLDKNSKHIVTHASGISQDNSCRDVVYQRSNFL